MRVTKKELEKRIVWLEKQVDTITNRLDFYGATIGEALLGNHHRYCVVHCKTPEAANESIRAHKKNGWTVKRQWVERGFIHIHFERKAR